MKQILIIEDKQDLIALLEFNLRKDGFEVSFAKSGEDGLRIARTNPPDIILLDSMLPGINGLEVGADDYITKPFSPKVLIARLRVLLRRNASKGELRKKIINAGKYTVKTENMMIKYCTTVAYSSQIFREVNVKNIFS